jgi:hypothetical protein
MDSNQTKEQIVETALRNATVPALPEDLVARCRTTFPVQESIYCGRNRRKQMGKWSIALVAVVGIGLIPTIVVKNQQGQSVALSMTLAQAKATMARVRYLHTVTRYVRQTAQGESDGAVQRESWQDTTRGLVVETHFQSRKPQESILALILPDGTVYSKSKNPQKTIDIVRVYHYEDKKKVWSDSIEADTTEYKQVIESTDSRFMKQRNGFFKNKPAIILSFGMGSPKDNQQVYLEPGTYRILATKGYTHANMYDAKTRRSSWVTSCVLIEYSYEPIPVQRFDTVEFCKGATKIFHKTVTKKESDRMWSYGSVAK